jgi:N-acetylglutamate synthase-like GNAT family acetyltransferase
MISSRKLQHKKFEEFASVWRQATSRDLYLIDRIGNEAHGDLPERLEVFTEKFNLFPEGYRVLEHEGLIEGYGIAHPWSLPENPRGLFIHDIVVLPQARGHRASEKFVELVATLARGRDIPFLALVSVYDTHSMWRDYGFDLVDDLSLAEKLKSYGGTARYMTLRLT